MLSQEYKENLSSSLWNFYKKTIDESIRRQESVGFLFQEEIDSIRDEKMQELFSAWLKEMINDEDSLLWVWDEIPTLGLEKPSKEDFIQFLREELIMKELVK